MPRKVPALSATLGLKGKLRNNMSEGVDSCDAVDKEIEDLKEILVENTIASPFPLLMC